MTVIAAVRDPKRGETWIASDTMSVNSGTKMFTARKWVVRKPWAVGIAGDYRTTAILAAHADDLFNGLAGAFDFSCRARGLLEADGYNADQTTGAKGWGQEMILAHPGGVWNIGACFAIVDVPDGEVWADGSGRAYGLGAAFAAKGKPKDRLRAAIEAAIRYSDGCGGEVWTEKLSGAA